jgi:hypothetical protein
MKINFIKQIKLRIRKFFYDRYVKRYLAIDSTIFDLFSKPLEISTDDVNSYKRNEKYKRIMKMLKSKAYKDYFFKAIKHNLNNKNSISSIKPFSNTVLDKISIFIAKKYIYFFNKKLYNSILSYKNWNKKIVDMDSEIDRYMKETTVEERLERAVKFGIIFSTSNVNLDINELYNKMNPEAIDKFNDFCITKRISEESSTSEKDEAIQSIITSTSSSTDIKQEVLKDMENKQSTI